MPSALITGTCDGVKQPWQGRGRRGPGRMEGQRDLSRDDGSVRRCGI